MVSIIKIERESLSPLKGRALDLDGYYYKLYKNGKLLASFDLIEIINSLVDSLLESKELYIISYDTLSFIFMKKYGRRRYKLFLSNFLRAIRVLECSTNVKAIFIRYSAPMKNDPGNLEDYSKDCY
jgi:hypothetical protein